MARMLFWILPLFFALELYVLVLVAGRIGAFATIGLVLLSSAAGIFLLRLYGLNMALKIQQDLTRGVMPENPLVDGLCLTAAACLFIFPGFVSDGIAVLLLLPFVRRMLQARLLARMDASGHAGAGVHTQTGYMDETGRMVWKETGNASRTENETPPSRRQGAVIIDCDAKDVTGQEKKE